MIPRVIIERFPPLGADPPSSGWPESPEFPAVAGQRQARNAHFACDIAHLPLTSGIFKRKFSSALLSDRKRNVQKML
jgi:hypothetical protein